MAEFLLQSIGALRLPRDLRKDRTETRVRLLPGRQLATHKKPLLQQPRVGGPRRSVHMFAKGYLSNLSRVFATACRRADHVRPHYGTLVRPVGWIEVIVNDRSGPSPLRASLQRAWLKAAPTKASKRLVHFLFRAGRRRAWQSPARSEWLV